MNASKLQRSLSVFIPTTRQWAPVSSIYAPNPVTRQFPPPTRFSLITQNLDGLSSRPIARARKLLDNLLLNHLVRESQVPDIIFLQEVTRGVRKSILDDPNIRDAFFVTDAEDGTSFDGVPFANMTLLSRQRFATDPESQKERDRVQRGEKFMLGPVFRVTLPSKYGRCALSVDIVSPYAPATTCRLVNVHLDSLWDTLHHRIEQVKILSDLLREPGCGGGLIAGDFNAISPKDHTLLKENGLVDAWVALKGEQGLGGATWGVGVHRNDRLGRGRLDKVAMLGVEAKDMEILRPGSIAVPKPGGESDSVPCSDHYGLKLDFTV